MNGNNLKGFLGWKGERGFSAYEVAVQNGFIGTEKDWLATIGTTNYVGEDKTIYTAGAGDTIFGLPSKYTSDSVVEVYIEGEKLNSNEYTVNQSEKTVVLTNPISVNSTTVEINILTMASYELPIVETINSSSTNETTPGTKAVYDYIEETKETIETSTNEKMNEKLNLSNIKVLTGSISNIGAGETAITDIDYPTGFNKNNTLIIGKMSSNNNVYYDVTDFEATTNGYPGIKTIALTDDVIRVWMENTNSSTVKIGYYKITLLRVD